MEWVSVWLLFNANSIIFQLHVCISWREQVNYQYKQLEEIHLKEIIYNTFYFQNGRQQYNVIVLGHEYRYLDIYLIFVKGVVMAMIVW